MGFFDFFKKAVRGYEFKINRDILIKSVENDIEEADEINETFVSEFYLRKAVEDKEELHLTVINYDAPCDSPGKGEEDLSGLIIWVNNGGPYNPNEDEKFYSIQSFIDSKLMYFPEEFILRNDLGMSTMLEPYQI